MRDLIRSILAGTGVLLLMSFGDVVISSRMFLDEPRVHIVQDGESFGYLADKYYGHTKYWRALALINRAPNKDLIYPGEPVILPGIGAVVRVSKAKKLSEVNEIVNAQYALAALEKAGQLDEFQDKAPFWENSGPLELEDSAENPASRKLSGQSPDEIIGGAGSTHVPAGEQTAFSPAENPAYIENDSFFASGWSVAFAIIIVLFVFGLFFTYFRNRNHEEPEDIEIGASTIESLTKNSAGRKKTGRYEGYISPLAADILTPKKRGSTKKRKKEMIPA